MSVPWEVVFEILLSAFQKSQGLLVPSRGLFSHTGLVTTPHPDIGSPLHHYSPFWSFSRPTLHRATYGVS